MFKLRNVFSPIARMMIGRFTSGFADQFLMFAVPLLIFKTTGSVTKSGIIFFIEWLPRVISLPIAGAIVSKVGRMKTLIFADLFRAIALAITFLLIQRLSPQSWFWPLALGSATCSFLYAQSFIALESALPQVMKRSEIYKGQSFLQISEQSSLLLAPLVAGFISTHFSMEVLIIMAAFLFFIACINTYNLKIYIHFEDNDKLVEKDGVWISKALTGFRAMSKHPKLVAMVIVALFINLMIGTIFTLNPAIAVGMFGVSDQNYGLLNAFVGLSGIGILLLIPFLKSTTSLENIAKVALLMLIAFAIMVSLTINFHTHLIGFGGLLASTMIFNVYMRTTRANLIDSTDLPRVIATMVFLNQLAMPASGLIVSKLGTFLNPEMILRILILIGTVGVGVGFFILCFSLRRDWRFGYERA